MTIKHQLPTKSIFHNGFGGISSIIPRITFCVSRQVRSPLSLTAHSFNRYVQL